jgi:hypothetical protein
MARSSRKPARSLPVDTDTKRQVATKPGGRSTTKSTAAKVEKPATKAAATKPAATKAAPAKSATKKPSPRPTSPAIALERVRAVCLGLAGVEEKVSHGRPSFAVRGKAFAMFMDDHHGDGRLALWCKAPPGMQEVLVQNDPAHFFAPPYVGPRGWVGVRLEAPDWDAVAACVRDAHAMAVPRARAKQQ